MRSFVKLLSVIEKDGHVHSPSCLHRHADDPLEAYVIAAERAGIKEITFSEHSPIPDSLLPYCSYRIPTIDETMVFFQSVKEFRAFYKGPVKINVGLEVEYFEGYEEEIREMLAIFGPQIEEALLSVHFVKIDNAFYDLSASKEHWPKTIAAAGDGGNLYDAYYETLMKSIDADLGPYKPTRIAHPTLIRAQKLFFLGLDHKPDLLDLFAKKVKDAGYSVELNTQGLRQQGCQEIYGEALLPYLYKYKIPVCLGSDAHKADDVAGGFNNLIFQDNLSKIQTEWKATI